MPVFHDRRTGEIKDLTREDYVNALHGSGESGFRQLFPGEQSSALTPWSGVGGLKHRAPYEQSKVSAALREPASKLVEVDPRNLRATQPEITRAGVEYYMGQEHRRTGETFADRMSPGNRYPVVYSRTHPVTGNVENMILSGHHRAAAALLQGRQLHARYIQGGYGEER